MIKRTKLIVSLFLFVVLVSCGANTTYNIGISKGWDISNKSWVQEEAFTYPEERNVATKHPIIPVIVENLAK
tara:strand:- start:523 stop:738 length:216 start_codon:yes stop_codon:yes gene_type:complete